ncbi:MAG: hypothetical protein KGQ94_09900, partial [Alphaproteobacteria bacterium]|nr:hypothetical protein [Alphaproteobacteria bacterium]
MTKPTNGLLLAALLMLPGCAHVTATPAPAPKAAPAAARYNPLKAFTKLTLPQAVNSYRAGNGAPGP